MERKYELTAETKIIENVKLHRIRALRNFRDVEIGDLGGWIEKEENLSHDGDSWVYDDAMVYNNAQVCDDACICEYARVYGNAGVFDYSKVYDHARMYDYSIACENSQIYDCAHVYENAHISGWTQIKGNNVRVHGIANICAEIEIFENANISSDEDYIVFKNWWSSGRYFVWTRSNNMWRVGCFFGTGEELIRKAYLDGEICGREYERIVRYVESILDEENKMKITDSETQ